MKAAIFLIFVKRGSSFEDTHVMKLKWSEVSGMLDISEKRGSCVFIRKNMKCNLENVCSFRSMETCIFLISTLTGFLTLLYFLMTNWLL